MKDGMSITEDDAIILTSTKDAPFSFTVTITGARPTESSTRMFQVTGADPVTGSIKTCEYRLIDREHKSYINFFECLARDFGGRLPYNCQPRPKPTFKASYRALLTENIAPGILYGYGDPAVLRVGEGLAAEGSWYYLVATSNDAPDSFPIIRSRNLIDWEFVGFVFPRGRKPEWAADGEFVSDYWAAEMHKIGSEFRVYFVARDKSTRVLSIGMAKSSRPDGPFIAGKKPILEGNVIDPHIFLADDNTSFLYWKEDNNGVWPSRLNHLLHDYTQFIIELFPQKEDQITASFIQTLWPWVQTLEPMERFFIQQILIEAVTSTFSAFHDRLSRLLDEQSDTSIQDDIRAVLQFMRTAMYAQELSPDGSSFVGERTKIIENDQSWEAHLVEGMWVTKHQGKYYLFYAGNDFSTDQYGIGVAIADSPLGPYRKMPGPLLKSTADWSGPGHPSVAMGPDGNPQLILHAFFPGSTGYKEFRALLAASITFEEDGVVLQ
jgi:arabinan endo-1,5-alpha-L-arabinosidase